MVSTNAQRDASTGRRCYRFGGFRLDPEARRLLRDDQAVPLKPKVFDLLVTLVESHPRLLTKQQLMDRLWPSLHVEEGSLTQAVYELRRALGRKGAKQGWVETVPRRGYRFAGPVHEESAPPAPPSGDPAVHQLFLECRHHWHRWTPEGWYRSIECGRRALALDPSHAATYSWMAASYCALAITGTLPPCEAFGRALDLVSQALRLDARLAEAHEVRGAIELFHHWDWQAAETALRRALELDPRNAGARDLHALLMTVLGRTEEALREVARARRDAPLSLLINTDVGNVSFYARRFEAAEEQLRRTLDLDPWFAHARFALGHVLLQLGRPSEAVVEMRKAAEYSGIGEEHSADLACALAAAGERAAAEAIRDALVGAAGEGGGWVDPYRVALAHVGLDEPQQVFSWLEKAFEQRSRELIYLRVNPLFDSLRDDARFHRLIRRVGLGHSGIEQSSPSSFAPRGGRY